MGRFNLPTKEFSPVVAKNRIAAATGGMSIAMVSSSADYNGHVGHITWVERTQQYTATYTWGGLRYLCRGSFEDCLTAALKVYNGYQKGWTFNIQTRVGDTEAAELCGRTPEVMAGDAPHLFDSSWWTWRHQVAHESSNAAFRRQPMTIADFDLMETSVDRIKYEDAVMMKHRRLRR